MTVRLDDMLADLDPAGRRRIEDRTADLIAEEMTLRELCKARRLTQVAVARANSASVRTGRRLAARATKRPAALDAAQGGGSHGGQHLAHRAVSRPTSGRVVRYHQACATARNLAQERRDICHCSNEESVSYKLHS